MKRICVGILAHVDAGKTTCVESMLYNAGNIRKMGRVDHQDTFLDYDQQERDRGITIYSKEANYKWNDSEIYILDTPGHVDFSSEMERVLSVLDLAIVFYIVIDSNPDGVMTTKIFNYNLADWKITEEELFKIARQNMERQFPVCVHTLKNVLLEGILEHGEEIDEEDVFLIKLEKNLWKI